MSRIWHKGFNALPQLLSGAYNSGRGVRQFFPKTQAEALAWSGIDLSTIWPCQEASGNLVPSAGTVQLAPVNTPLFRQPTPFAGRVAIGFTDAGTHYFQADSTAFSDFDLTTSQAWIFFMSEVGAHSLVRLFFQKGSGAPDVRVYANGNTVSLHLRDNAAGSFVATLTDNHDGYDGPLSICADRAGGLLTVASLLGSAQTSIAAAATASNALAARVGSTTGGLSAWETDVPLIAHGTGAAVEGKDWPAVLTRIWRGV